MNLSAWRRVLVIALLGWAIPLLGLANLHASVGASAHSVSPAQAAHAHAAHCPEASADATSTANPSGHWPSHHCVDCFGLALLGPCAWATLLLPQPAEVATARPLVLTKRPNRILRPPNA